LEAQVRYWLFLKAGTTVGSISKVFHKND